MTHPTLPPADDLRGASMGRHRDVLEPMATIKFHLYRMPMSPCGAYDSGGAYWGCGSYEHGWMYHAYGDGPEYFNEMFIRALDRDDAKRQVYKEYPNAKFYR